MNRDELWKIYVAKNPQFAEEDSRFTMTGKGLKKLFDQTWEQAEKHGKVIEEVRAKLDKKIDSVLPDFGNLFGRK